MSTQNSDGAVKEHPNLKPFKKGQSGNPGGKAKGIAAIAREHTGKAVEVLVAAMSHEDAKVQVVAAREILDRGYGKPVTMSADVTDRLDDLDDDAIDAALAAIRNALESRVESGGEEAEAPRH